MVLDKNSIQKLMRVDVNEGTDQTTCLISALGAFEIRNESLLLFTAFLH